jgi:hypothetical protein
MHRILTALVFCALLPDGATAQTPGASAAPAAGTPTPDAASLEAYREWQREHEAWQRRYAAWEQRYALWLEEQARLDDGFMLSVGLGPSPVRVNARFSGGDRVNFPTTPPFSNVNFRGIGAALDVRMGWLLQNDPYLKDYWFRDDKLHDQLYLTLDVLTRSSAYPQLRFADKDSANRQDYLRPVYLLDLVAGVGMTYLIYPYRTSLSTTVGFGLIGIQGDDGAVRTNPGPALNVRLGQEWAIRENWRSGFAVNYGYVRAINPRRIKVNHLGLHEENYQESFASHLLSIQWINTFTPPKYRRGVPPARPQRYNSSAPPQVLPR